MRFKQELDIAVQETTLNKSRHDTVVIARYATRKALAYVTGVLVFCALLLLTLRHPAGISLKAYLESRGPFVYEWAMAAWICGVLLFVRQMAILNQIVFKHAAAVWIADGRIFYMNIYWNILFVSVSCDQIESVSMGSMGSLRPDGIVMRQRGGGKRSIATWILSEPAEIVLSRLKDAIATTPSTV